MPASASLSPKTLESMYKTHAPDAYNLADRGYITQIHPLELWVVKTLRAAPKTDLDTLYESGAGVRREVYNWLFKTSRKNAQDIRIQSLLEVEAFDRLLVDWKRLGYPFDNITPSYATAIGSSGDRPAALAELMSILVNDGVRQPMVSLTGLHFAANTPYRHPTVDASPPKGERLMPAEVAQTVRRALARVVESGTAARLAGALKDAAGKPLTIGGKTGTGDHRFERYGKGGQLLESRVVNRTATFVVLSRRPLLRHPDGAGAGRAGRPVRLHQLAHRADPENPAAAAAAASVSAAAAHRPGRSLNAGAGRSRSAVAAPATAPPAGEGKTRRLHQPGRSAGQTAGARPGRLP